MKVLMTGACGKCGTALVRLNHDKVFLDCLDPVKSLERTHFVKGDVGDSKLLVEAMQGCDAVVHLAYTWPDAIGNWEEVLYINTENTRNILKTASYLDIDRVIYASSNHAVGMYEIHNAPRIYELGHGIIVDRNTPVRPDSLYGVGKVFSENLGRFYSENGGPKFYAIRIGAVLGAGDDHPFAYAEEGVKNGLWKRDSDVYQYKEKRLRAMWQSRRDFAQMIDLCLRYQGPAFDIFYGVSDNPRRWLDIEYAKEMLGYQPQDNGEYLTSSPALSGEKGIHIQSK
jgi:NAD+ dependent glucose-6-phosphate dehydrogenase